MSNINYIKIIAEGVDFGRALEAVKEGYRISRRGWNGKGMFVYFVQGGDYVSKTEVAKEIGDTVRYEPYLALYNVKGTINTWVPSVSDILSEDWYVSA